MDGGDPCVGVVCHPDAVCSAATGAPRCACGAGFYGDGETLCEPVAPVALDAFLKGGDGRLGESLSMSDDGSVVASGGDLRVFRRGDGGWSDDGAPGGVWGTLSGDGERLVSLGADGSLQVFVRRDGEWELEERVAPQGEPGCAYPCVAISGDGALLLVAANAPGPVLLSRDRGELARAFARDGSAWSAARVLAGPPTISRQGGLPVALSADGETIAVGGGWSNDGWALIDDDLGATELAPPADDDGLFGVSVAVSRDGLLVAVGAPFVWDDGPRLTAAEAAGRDVAGGVALYRRLDDAWGLEAVVRSPHPGAGDRFGEAVALDDDGDALLVGAPAEDGGGAGVDALPGGRSDESGAAFVFRRVGERWFAARYLKADRPGAGDRYGSSVAMSGDGTQYAVGALLEDTRGDGVDPPPNDDGAARGAVYVYR